MFAIALAALTVAGCGGDSLPPPSSPTAPRPLVAPAAPSPPSSTVPAPPPADARSEPGGTVAAAPVPETAGQESSGPSEESSGSEPLPNEGRPGSATVPQDATYRIESFTATAETHESIRVRWQIALDDIVFSRNLNLRLRRREAPSGTWDPLPAAGQSGSMLDTGLDSETRYEYAISVTGDSARASATTLPPGPVCVPPPLTVTANASSASAIDVEWQFTSEPRPDCVFTYSLQRRTTGSYTTIATDRRTKDYLDSGLTSNTRYTYKVTAHGSDGESSDTDAAKTFCPAPSGLVLTATASRSSISLSWTIDSLPSGCEPSYSIWRKEGSGSYEEIVGSQTGTTHLDTGLSSGTTYTYRVRATNDGGTVLDEDEATTPGSSPPPEPPTGLRANGISSSAIRVRWNAVQGADRYDIRWQRGSGSWGAPEDAGSGTSYRAGGLRSNTNYSFEVRTVDGSRTSDWSSSADATTWPPPPNPEPEVSRPTGLSATAGSWSEIEVSWNAVSGADSYDIQRMESGGSWGDTVDAGAGTSYSYTGLTMNTEYSIRVRTVDGSRTSGWTASVSATTDVQPPGNPEANEESASSVRVTWDAVSGADRYDLRYREDGGSWGSPVNVGSATEYLVGSLTAATRYDFQLRSVAGSRTSDWTASVSATTRSPDPDPPANFRSTGATATTVALGWDAVSGADRYRIRRAASGESGWESFTAETTSAVDDGLDPATTYRYQIQTVPAEGRPSEWSAPALSVATAALGIPANLTVTGQTATTVSLAWDAVAEAEGYELRRDGGAVIAVGEVTSHTDERLTPDTAYAYEVRASLGSAHSAWSPAVPARTARVMPPENLRAKATSAFSVEVGWDPVSGADGYEVDRVHGPGSVRVTGTRHEETGLAPETTYALRVRAIAGRTESDWASVSAVTLAFSAPENFAASASETTVELRWDPVPGTETYRIRRRQGSGSWERLEEPGTSASDEGLAEETEYEYQVRARQGPHKSPWSAAARVTTGFVPLTAPRGFRVEERGGAHLEMSWKAASGAEGYDLERLGALNGDLDAGSDGAGGDDLPGRGAAAVQLVPVSVARGAGVEDLGVDRAEWCMDERDGGRAGAPRCEGGVPDGGGAPLGEGSGREHQLPDPAPGAGREQQLVERLHRQRHGRPRRGSGAVHGLRISGPDDLPAVGAGLPFGLDRSRACDHGDTGGADAAAGLRDPGGGGARMERGGGGGGVRGATAEPGGQRELDERGQGAGDGAHRFGGGDGEGIRVSGAGVRAEWAGTDAAHRVERFGGGGAGGLRFGGRRSPPDRLPLRTPPGLFGR